MPEPKISLGRAVGVMLSGFVCGVCASLFLMLLSRMAAESHSNVLDGFLRVTSPVLWPTSAILSGSSNSPEEEYKKWALAIGINGLVYACIVPLVFFLFRMLPARRKTQMTLRRRHD